jgi:hypothetical protein
MGISSGLLGCLLRSRQYCVCSRQTLSRCAASVRVYYFSPISFWLDDFILFGINSGGGMSSRTGIASAFRRNKLSYIYRGLGPRGRHRRDGIVGEIVRIFSTPRSEVSMCKMCTKFPCCVSDNWLCIYSYRTKSQWTNALKTRGWRFSFATPLPLFSTTQCTELNWPKVRKEYSPYHCPPPRNA